MRTVYLIVTVLSKFVDDVEVFSSRTAARRYFRRKIMQNFDKVTPEDLLEAEEKQIVEGNYCTVNWITKTLPDKSTT